LVSNDREVIVGSSEKKSSIICMKTSPETILHGTFRRVSDRQRFTGYSSMPRKSLIKKGQHGYCLLICEFLSHFHLLPKTGILWTVILLDVYPRDYRSPHPDLDQRFVHPLIICLMNDRISGLPVNLVRDRREATERSSISRISCFSFQVLKDKPVICL
jgi:hypothetical protein